MIAAIDTNILLDILIPDEEFIAGSKGLLDRYAEKGRLTICEIVYAELASQFPSERDLEDFLADTNIRLVYSNRRSLSLTGERWKAYAKNRSDKLQCPKCGYKVGLTCPECEHKIHPRLHIISDFIIGANASIQADLLLTRDRGFYKKWFFDLKIGCKGY